MFRMMLDMPGELDTRIGELDKEIARRAREDVIARRLMTIPGVDDKCVRRRVTGTVKLSSGKFAVVETAHEFTLVP